MEHVNKGPRHSSVSYDQTNNVVRERILLLHVVLKRTKLIDLQIDREFQEVMVLGYPMLAED